jgi:putative membrane-bound dehydrogenase-like protein
MTTTHGSPLAILLGAIVVVLAGIARADEPEPPEAQSPLSAEESLRHFRLADGLQLELAAAEPEVVDPVAVRFDELARMWVVEMRDYPNGPPAGNPPLSCVKLLEDLDGDGRFETAHLFADELLFATGLQPWRGGAIVTYSGRIEWFADDDGDGHADRRESWFSGFAEENSQLRANHPRFALDNRVYVANGLRGGNIKSDSRSAAGPISINGRDFRFDPRTLAARAVSGHGQFGLTFDDYGRRFTCTNRNPLIHVVLSDDDLARNPYLAVPAVVHDVAAAGDASRVFPIGKTWTTSILHAGQFTAACGVEIYRGDALPAEFYGNAFTCEPTGNLVHREVLTPAGATFTARPAYEGDEFLASSDSWFRPVNLETGPDGALYVVDMYRAVIEHPDWVPEELKHRPDERCGDDRGRIYRVVPSGWRRPEPPRWGEATSQDLAAALEHPNAWRRETAARLLYERQDHAAPPALASMVRTGAEGRSRVHALWALAGLDELDDAAIEAALSDGDGRVREQAVRLAAPRLTHAANLRRLVIDLADDGDARVRFEVALALGQVPGDEAVESLARIALAGIDDVWTRRAVATAVPDRAGKLMAAITLPQRVQPPPTPSVHALVGELARLVGARGEPTETAAVIDRLLETSAIFQDRIELSVLLGLAQGAQSRGKSLTDLLADAPASRAAVQTLFEEAGRLAVNGGADAPLRTDACAVLQYAPDDVAVPALAELLEGDQPPELFRRAVAALAAHGGRQVGVVLSGLLPRQTPAMRPAILDALLATPERTRLLLDAIESGAIKATELDALRAGRLTQQADPLLRARAVELLAAALPADRAKVLADYRPSLDLASDAANGRAVFKKRCIACHRIGDLGVDVAPSIADARTKTREQLLIDIVQPSKAIDAAYVSYTVVTTDGRTEVGLIAAETATSITLRQAEGKTETLLRSEIDELRSNGVSLMPDGLERDISLQEMADLISFIKNWRYVDAKLPARAGR